MRMHLGGLVAVFFVLCLLPASASADTTTYTYTGDPFGLFTSPPPPASVTSLSGSFTLALPLGPGFQYGAPVTPSSYSFTDGLTTWTSSSPVTSVLDFRVSTDATGDINDWDIQIATLCGSGDVCTMSTANAPSLDTTLATTMSMGSTVQVYGAEGLPGSWSVSTTTAPTPEPSSLLMLGLGLLALFGARLGRC